jgi:hypothetical protein
VCELLWLVPGAGPGGPAAASRGALWYKRAPSRRRRWRMRLAATRPSAEHRETDRARGPPAWKDRSACQTPAASACSKQQIHSRLWHVLAPRLTHKTGAEELRLRLKVRARALQRSLAVWPARMRPSVADFVRDR